MNRTEIYADGSCSGGRGPGGWAYVIVHPDGTREEGSGSQRATTNNVMEMTGVLKRLQALAVPADVTVITDSRYVEQAFSRDWISSWERRGWQRRDQNGDPLELANADLWKALVAEVRRHRDVEWRWIRGHSGYPLNERADRLAVTAASRVGGGLSKALARRSASRAPKPSQTSMF